MKSAPPPPESAAAFRTALLEHYDRCRRSLPWRGESDPYRILVSEVMLQQTRVETVLEYYGAWLERFPDLESLAAADADDVLRAWEGMGYYRRALNLHQAAKVVRERPDGVLPASYAELRELPGVGEYTAGAVASIAFGEAVPAVDGNVRRLIARLYDVPDPKPAWLREAAASLVDAKRPGDWSQAVMELGATICRPVRPACDACPVSDWCAARAAGTQHERPARRTRRSAPTVTFVLAVLHARGRVLLVRRPDEGLLAGLWALPERETSGAREAAQAAAEIAQNLGVAVSGRPKALPVCEHSFTHLRATYLPYALSAGLTEDSDRRVWVDARAPTGLAMPAAQRRVLSSFVEQAGA